jgi:hypothetical protein
MTDTPARLRKTTSLPASTVMGGRYVGPVFRCAASALGGVALDCVEDPLGWCRRCQEAVGQRERLRGEYEDVHGTDRALWPVQHPGVVLDAMPSTAHGACLGCQWFDVRGHSMRHSDWFERASIWPHRHEISNGEFLDGPRLWRGGRFDPP